MTHCDEGNLTRAHLPRDGGHGLPRERPQLLQHVQIHAAAKIQASVQGLTVQVELRSKSSLHAHCMAWAADDKVTGILPWHLGRRLSCATCCSNRLSQDTVHARTLTRTWPQGPCGPCPARRSGGAPSTQKCKAMIRKVTWRRCHGPCPARRPSGAPNTAAAKTACAPAQRRSCLVKAGPEGNTDPANAGCCVMGTCDIKVDGCSIAERRGGLLFLADNAASAVSVAVAASACSHTFGGCTTRALVEGHTVKEAQSVLLGRSASAAAAPHQGERGVQARQLRRHEARVPARHRQLWPKTPICIPFGTCARQDRQKEGFPFLPSMCCHAASGRRRCVEHPPRPGMRERMSRLV